MHPFSFATTAQIICESGSARRLAALCVERGARSVFIVTDPGITQLGLLAEVLPGFLLEGLTAQVFDQVVADPPEAIVQSAVAQARALKAELIVGFGGGSSMDVAKLVALLAHPDCSQELADIYGVGNAKGRRLSLIQVPTTAGTGSEVGRASVITDEAEHIKRIIFHPRMLPALVILDPQLSIGLPPKITAATGIDALSHSLEAYCSPLFHPMAEGIALEGMRLVQQYLPRAVAKGSDVEARLQMLVASTMGATAFQRGLGAMHALAHPIGALYDAHHGLLNAVLMPYVLQANRASIEPQMERLARYLNLPRLGFIGVLDWVLHLRNEVGIPHSLAQIGIDDSRIEQIGQMAEVDPSAGTNPIGFSASEYSRLFEKALHGGL